MSTTNRILDRLPVDSVTNLYDLAALYGAVSIRTTYEEMNEVEENMQSGNQYPEHNFIRHLSFSDAILLTPQENEDVVGESESFIAAKIDMSGGEPTLAPDPVSVETYTPALKYGGVYIARHSKSSGSIDFSVTNHGSDKTPEEISDKEDYFSRYLTGRFKKWANKSKCDSGVRNYRQSNSTPILDAMHQLGKDEDEMARLQEAFLQKATFGSQDVFVSVRVKTEEDGRYRYPVEVEELRGASLQNKQEDIVGVGVQRATGSGADYLSNHVDEVRGDFGGFFSQYGKKQRGVFHQAKGETAWQSFPMTKENIILCSGFSDINDVFSFTSNGLSMFYVPYPLGEITETKFDMLYTIFEQFYNGTDTSKRDNLVNLLLSPPEGAEFGLYTIFQKRDENPTRTYYESIDTERGLLLSLKRGHKEATDHIEDMNYFGYHVPNNVYSPLISSGSGDVVRAILFGEYFRDTCLSELSPPDEDASPDVSTMDTRVRFLSNLLSNGSINRNSLISSYVDYIIDEHRSGQDRGDEIPFPREIPIRQLIQHEALQSCSALHAEQKDERSKFEAVRREPVNTDSDDPLTLSEKIDSLRTSYSVLDDDNLFATFLLGGLVGALSRYQKKDEVDVSRKLVEKYAPETIRKTTIKRTSTDVISKYNQYENANNMPKTYTYPYIERLPKSMLSHEPEDWDASKEDIQWAYSLGVAFGLSTTSDKGSGSS